MKYIFTKEIQLLFKDVRFYIFIIVIMLIAIFSGLISSKKYSAIKAEENYQIRLYEDQLREKSKSSLSAAANYEHLALKRIEPTIFLAGSETIDFPNISIIGINSLFFGNPNLYYPQKTTKNRVWINTIIRPDLTFIIEVIFSFMIILLMHNIISDEKEAGLLKIILSNKIKRWEIISGKVLAGVFIVFIALSFCFLIQLIVIRILGEIQVTGEVLMKLPAMFLLSMIYLSLWILLSVLFSIIFRKSIISLSFLLLTWVLFIFIIPSVGKLLVQKVEGKLPSANEIRIMNQSFVDELFGEADENDASWRGGNLNFNKRDNHRKEKNLSPIYEKYVGLFNRQQYLIAQKRINQLNFIYKFGSISPAILYKKLSEDLLGCGIAKETNYLNSIQLFREKLINTFIELDSKDPDSFHLFFLPNYMSGKPIDPKLIPRFSEANINFFVQFEKDWTWITLLLMEFVVCIYLCNIFFVNIDPR
ncbi:MAG: ABC transporter permease subunit [Chlorobi bacterium]|nr:ABC transporter permease subunit [Chlorobiota bacterium]